LDLVASPDVTCAGSAKQLPFAANMFILVITQQTLEHVQSPYQAVREMHRVMKKGGLLYCQVPFTIGYHPGPTDFWRFSREGIRELVEQACFVCEEVSIAVGPGTGFYRIAVEFFSVLSTILSQRLYYVTKAVVAVAFFPLKWMDTLLSGSSQADRIAGGYYVVARKTN
jgi:SAM-dependent methyltransferase